jgi:Flp pilus assembly protein TadD
VAALLALGSGCTNGQLSRSAGGYPGPEVRPAGGDTARLLHNAHYLSLMGRRDLALKELEEAYQQEPQNPKVANALARGYEEVGQWDRAQQIYLEALSRLGGNPVLQNNLCYSYYLAGKFQAAEACFRQALEQDPGNLPARNNLGLLLCRTGRQEKARRLWQEAEGSAAADKKLAEVRAFLAAAGSPAVAQLSPPAIAIAAAPTGSAAAPRGPAAPVKTGAKPEPDASPKAAFSPPPAKSQPPAASAPDRRRDKAGSAPAPGRTPSAWLKAAAARVPWQRERPFTAQELIETRIGVENGNGSRHLARHTRACLWEEGFNVVSIKNYLDFGVKDTVIYCRAGAVRVAGMLGEKFFRAAKVQVSEKLAKGVDVRVILGRDLLLNQDFLAALSR